MRRLAAVFGVWVVAALPVLADREEAFELDVVYVPTHQRAVDAMLKLAKVTSKDFVIDLGCGDGRIVVTAAKKCKARGLGVDLDPKRILESKENAVRARVADRVEFRQANVMTTDVREASVVTLFLLEEINVRLRPRLLSDLKPGTRVVSNSFSMRDWKPDQEVRHAKAYSETIYLWIIPAGVGGAWTWKTKLSDKEITSNLTLNQEFQVVEGVVTSSGFPVAPITKSELVGAELRFLTQTDDGGRGAVISYQGTVEGNTIRGTQTWKGGPHAGTYPWTATRHPVDLTGPWKIESGSLNRYSGTLHIRHEAACFKAVFIPDAGPTKEVALTDFCAWGSSIRFQVPSEGSEAVFSGTFGPDGGAGMTYMEQSDERTAWSARRVADK